MIKRIRWFAVLAALMLIVAACGGDDSGGDTTAPSGTDAPGTTEASGGTEAPGTTEESSSGEMVQVRWFVGLGTGGNPEQIEAQEAVVADFNATVGQEKGIELVLEIVQNDVAYDTLSTQIASGNAPDIIGPVGIRGANAFNGRWQDLEPLAEAADFDLGIWTEEQVDVWRTDEGLVGLPFGVFPAMMFYNKPLFDEAGLAYPPAEFGQDYEGQPWNMDTLRDISQFLTVDANGNDATSPDFDPENVIQFGYVDQWSEPQRFATMFGAGSMTNDNGTPNVPDEWRDAFNWYYDGIWTDNFIPNQTYADSELLASGNPFDSGNVAMAHTHLWFTCCVTNVSQDWDLAVVPEYNGVQTAALHADVFRILNTTEHPNEAFEVVAYFVTEGAAPLLKAYGAMPALESAQEAFFAAQDETYPQGVNWQVAIDSLAYPDIPSHEQDMPSFLKSQDRWGAFWSALNSTPGLDVDAEIERLISDLAVIYLEE